MNHEQITKEGIQQEIITLGQQIAVNKQKAEVLSKRLGIEATPQAIVALRIKLETEEKQLEANTESLLQELEALKLPTAEEVTSHVTSTTASEDFGNE